MFQHNALSSYALTCALLSIVNPPYEHRRKFEPAARHRTSATPRTPAAGCRPFAACAYVHRRSLRDVTYLCLFYRLMYVIMIWPDPRARVHTYTHTYVHICTHTCMRVRVGMHVRVRACVCGVRACAYKHTANKTT